MSDYLPQVDSTVVQRALQDPSVALPLAGLLLPNVTYSSGGRPVATLNVRGVLSGLGQVYGATQERQRQEDIFERMVAALQRQQGADPSSGSVSGEPVSIADRLQALQRPPMTALEFAQTLPPELRRTLLSGASRSLFGTSTPLLDLYTDLRKQQEAVQKSELDRLTQELIARIYKDNDDQEAIDGLIRLTGTAGWNLATTVRGRQAMTQLLMATGTRDAQEAQRMVDAGLASQVLTERYGFREKVARSKEFVSNFLASDAAQMLTPESKQSLLIFSDYGYVPDLNWINTQEKAFRHTRAVNKYSDVIRNLATGIPLKNPDVIFGEMAKDPDAAEFVERWAQLHAAAVSAQEQRELERQRLGISRDSLEEQRRQRELSELQIATEQPVRLMRELDMARQAATLEAARQGITDRTKIAEFIEAETAPLAAQIQRAQKLASTMWGAYLANRNPVVFMTITQAQIGRLLGEVNNPQTPIEQKLAALNLLENDLRENSALYHRAPGGKEYLASKLAEIQHLKRVFSAGARTEGKGGELSPPALPALPPPPPRAEEGALPSLLLSPAERARVEQQRLLNARMEALARRRGYPSLSLVDPAVRAELQAQAARELGITP